MRRIIAILVLSVLLTGCSGASETDTNATGTNPSSTPSQFHISSGTEDRRRLPRPHRSAAGESHRDP